MKIRFGYVAIALNLQDSSTSKTITLGNLQKLHDQKARQARLQRLVKENLENTLRILRYNNSEGIRLYRLTSKLVPFATYPLEFEWNYAEQYSKELLAIGTYIKETGMRVSFHPDHFTVINTPDERVFAEGVKDLSYHDLMFSSMKLGPEYKLVTHVGGFYGDKQQALERFAKNFVRLPEGIRARLILENDDKSYTALQVLSLCEELKLPMVLDLHHHFCNPGGDIVELLPRIWQTWKGEKPKIHVSSPKDSKNIRAHADYVEAAGVFDFLNLARELEQDFDVMVEAKMKDQAMFSLVKALSGFPGVSVEEGASIILT
jgi:UV DNA damage endonuclease